MPRERKMHGANEELSAKEVLFVHHYIINGGNGGGAAKAAGYAAASAHIQAHRLLEKQRVKDAIAAVIKPKLDELKIDANRVLDELAKMAFMPMDTVLVPALKPDELVPEVTLISTMKVSDKKGSLELIGKHLKMFVDRVEVSDDRPKVVIRDLTGKKKTAGSE